MGLVVQANGCGDLGGSAAVEEKATCVFDGLAGEVGVWGQAVCLLEAADQVCGVGMQDGCGLVQGEAGVGS